MERSLFDPTIVGASVRFTILRTYAAPNAHPLTLQELLGRARSTSTVPKSGPRLAELQGLLRTLHPEHVDARGRATMIYRTDLFRWDRVDPTDGAGPGRKP